MTRKQRYQYLLDYFRQQMPVVTTELQFASPFQLLVATVLSAQCTDKRVNEVTPALFSRFPDAATMAGATEEEVYGYVKSVSYPNSKTRHLVAMAKMLVSEFGGEVPSDPAMLIRLPGVGRKTANVVQAVAFGKAIYPPHTTGCCCMGAMCVPAVSRIVGNVLSTVSVRN